jgi:hypothetical protein
VITFLENAAVSFLGVPLQILQYLIMQFHQPSAIALMGPNNLNLCSSSGVTGQVSFYLHTKKKLKIIILLYFNLHIFRKEMEDERVVCIPQM